MSEQVLENEKDSRKICKYGVDCYQKNPEHLRKYQHPSRDKRKFNAENNTSKKIKLNIDDCKREQISSSDSDASNEVRKKENISSSNSDASNEHTRKETISSSDSDVSNEPEIKEKSSSDFRDKTVPVQSKEEKFNPKTFIQSRFLVELPSDFYHFWDFCKELKSTSPSEALRDVGLELVGPFDVLAGKFKNIKRPPEDYLCHWRYYYDPPEVLTVIKGDDTTGYHIGYFYDSPNEPPSFLVSNHGTKDGVFTKIGDNIFAAVSLYLEDLKKVGDPFKKMRIGKLSASLKMQAEKLNLNLQVHSKSMRERGFKVVAKTLNKIGLVVPYNKKTQLGYRELAMQDKELTALLTKLEKASPEQKSQYLSDLQPVLTYANIALDECDFGTGVKLGWELLYHGIDSLNSTISQFLSNSYRLLNKEPFAKIAETHMSNRKKGSKLSII